MPEGPAAEGDLRARCVALEKAYVHEVYKQLSANNNNQLLGGAPKLLANVTAFLSELEPGSVVADVGCGPGRYLSCRPDIAMLGVDSCWGMTELCRTRSDQNALCADNLSLPLRDEAFDAVISMAVIHHFASKERRIEALKEIARITRIGGRVLITVWAIQQDSNRKLESQDILVPYRQPSICTACHHTSSGNNYVQTAHLNKLSNSLCGANGGSNRLEKQLRRSCAVSYSTATSEDDCQSEHDFSIYNKPRLRRWAFTRGRSLEDSYSSDQSSPSDTCYSFVRRAVQKLSSASSSESRRSSFHRICRRPWLTDSTDSGTGINVSLSSAERMSESPDLYEEEAQSERHDVSKSESFDSDDFCEDDGFIELRNLDPESPEEQDQQQQQDGGGDNPQNRVSPLFSSSGLKHKSRSLGDMFSMIPSLLMRSRGRRSARTVDLQKRASTVSDPREYLLRSKDKSSVSRSSSTTSDGFMRFDYIRFLEELSPESSVNGNSSPTAIQEDNPDSIEENEPLLRMSDEEPLTGGESPLSGWNHEQAMSEVAYHSETSMRTTTLPIGIVPPDRATAEIRKDGAQQAMGITRPGAPSAGADGGDSASILPKEPQEQQEPPQQQQFEHGRRDSLQQQQQQQLQNSHVAPPLNPQVASIQLQAPHVDLASRRRLKFQGSRLQEKALRNQFSKKSPLDKLLRKRTLATRGYFSMPNLSVFSLSFNERSPATHLPVVLKRPPAPDITECELKLGIIDEHGNLRNPLRPVEHRGSFSSQVPLRLPAKRSLSIDTEASGAPFAGFGSAPLPTLRSGFNRRYSLSAVQGSSSGLLPGTPARSWASKARHDSLKSDTSVESESDSVVSVIYRSKASAGGSAGSNGGGFSDNSIDSEESIVSVIHRSAEDTSRAGSACGSRSWQASPLTISQTNSREGSFSSPEYSPTMKSVTQKTSEKIASRLLLQTSLPEDESAPERGTARQPPQTSAATDSVDGRGASRDETSQESGVQENEDSKTTTGDNKRDNTDDQGEEPQGQLEETPTVKSRADSFKLTPSSSSEDAPYMSDEEVQCEDIPESFELEVTESKVTQVVDQSRPLTSRRMCSPVEVVDVDDDSVLESIPEEDESCSPVKSPRSSKQEKEEGAGERDSQFPTLAELSRAPTLPQAKRPAAKQTLSVQSLPSSLPLALVELKTPPKRAIPAEDLPRCEPIQCDLTAATARSKPGSGKRRHQAGALADAGKLAQLAEALTKSLSASARDENKTTNNNNNNNNNDKYNNTSGGSNNNNNNNPLPSSSATTRVHSNVPEQKSSANSPSSSSRSTSSSTSCCTGEGMSSGRGISDAPSRTTAGASGESSPAVRALPVNRLCQQSGNQDCCRRASDVGPQSKSPQDRAKFSPQYSLPEQSRKGQQKELTASCEQLFRRRLSPQRQQQEVRSDPLSELLSGTKTPSSSSFSAATSAPFHQHGSDLSNFEEQLRGRCSVSPDHRSPASSSTFGPRRRTPDLLRTSPLEMLAQELRSSTDDLYRRAAENIGALHVDSQVERRSSPERRHTPESHIRILPDPRFEDALEDYPTKSATEYNYRDTQALSRVCAANPSHDCEESCDQLTELPEFVPQTPRYVGGRISAEGGIFYSDRDSPEDICLAQDPFLGLLQNVSAFTPPTSPDRYSDADESTASTTDQEISDLSSSLERLRVSCGLQPEMSSSAQPLNIVIEDFSDHGGSDAEISEACSSNAASNVHQLYVQERQGGSSSLSDHSDRSSASVQTVYKLETLSKDLSPEAPLEYETECNIESEDLKQEKLSLTSSSSDDSSDENFGENCCGNMTGHSAETYHRYYHVFRQGELDSLIEKYVHSLHILKSYYDHSNWCIVAERVQVWTI